MTRLIPKLLVLLAVLLLPLGMAPTAAVAQHQPIPMDMPAGHCPDQGLHHDMKGGIAECTMACAGALPAADFARHEPPLIICQPVQFPAAQRLDGLHPETATPPPKRS
jgi:hypothetical protein